MSVLDEFRSLMRRPDIKAACDRFSKLKETSTTHREDATAMVQVFMEETGCSYQKAIETAITALSEVTDELRLAMPAEEAMGLDDLLDELRSMKSGVF